MARTFSDSARRLTVIVAAVLVAASGCKTQVGGGPVKAKETDTANVALMDTGTYPTTLGHIFGAAGNDTFAQRLLEGHRLADFVTGPWQVDETLTQHPFLELLVQIQAIADTDYLGVVFGPAFSRVAAQHGYITGFSTRRQSPGNPPSRELTNAVLLFPDPAAASAAAAELAAADSPLPGQAPHKPTAIDKHPEAIAVKYARADGRKVVESFAAHGRYVLYQTASSGDISGVGKAPELILVMALDIQEKQIDRFVPTDAAKLGSLPLDPSGRMLAATLTREGIALPVNSGVWQRAGWLHFADDPHVTGAALQDAGVDYVSQRLATVYQTTNADAAQRLTSYLVRLVGQGSDIQPLRDQVPGFPDAKCFRRAGPALPADAPATWRMMKWQYKCVAKADRYAYTVFSETEKDVMQQASAQYRILAGK
jgi:hypothetical protein